MEAKVRLLLTVILIGYGITGRAVGQSLSGDQVKEFQKQLTQGKRDTAAVRLLFELGQSYASKVRRHNGETHFNDSAIYFLKETIRLSDSLQFEKFKNESRVWLGRIYLTDGNLKEGEEWFDKAIDYEHALHHREKEAYLWALKGASFLRSSGNELRIRSCYKRAIEIYKELKLWEKEVDAQIQLADHELDVGNFRICEEQLLSALRVYRSHNYKTLFNVYYLLAVCNRSTSDYSTSLSYVIKCLDNMEAMKDTAASQYFYSEIAYVYAGLNRAEESIYWYKKALRKREIAHASKAQIYVNACFLIAQLIKQKKEKEALDLITRLKSQYPPSLPMEWASLSQSLGRCYEAMQKYDMAEQQFLEMIKQYLKANHTQDFLSIAFQDIGAFYIHRERYDIAKPYLINAIQMPSGVNTSLWKKDIYLMLFKVDSAQGNYVSAIEHLQRHDQLDDSIFNASKMREIEKMQAQFKVSQKEKEIAALNEVNNVQHQNIEQAAIIRNFVFVAILAVLGFVYYRYKLKQSSNRKLEEQQDVINKKNQNLEHLVKEREWLLKEIHHRVKNNFQMVMSLLGTQSHYIKSPETLQSLEESQQRIYAMSLVHQRLYQSGNFSAINMKEYIHELVDYLRNSFTIRKHILFDIQVEEIELNIAHALPIGLILNEAVTNAIKYAFDGRDEGRIEISLRHQSEDVVELAIADNGIGLPPHIQFENSATMGLNLMRGLSEEIEGDLSIVTHNGTAIRLLFNCELNLSPMPYSNSAI